MKLIAIIMICSISFLHGASQPLTNTGCEPLGVDNKYVWFTDNYFGSLIDNALRCFRLNSRIDRDSCIRIWIDDDNFPDTPFIYGIKLFEFGAKKGRYYAQYNTLELVRAEGETQSVRCIKKKTVKPLSGWIAFEKSMRKLKLNHIYAIPIPHEREDLVNDGRFMELQYLFEDVMYTTDFSSISGINTSKYEQVRRFWKLLQLINQEFSIDLLSHSNGRKPFETASLGVGVFEVTPEVQLDPVDSMPKVEEPKGFLKNYLAPYISRMYWVDSLSPLVSYMIDTTLYTVNDSIERDKRLDTMPLAKFYAIDYEASESHPEGIIVLRTMGSQTRAEINKFFAKAKRMFVDRYPKGIRELSITEDPALLFDKVVPAWKAKAAINRVKPENIIAIKVWEIPVDWGSLKRNKKNGLVQLWLKKKSKM